MQIFLCLTLSAVFIIIATILGLFLARSLGRYLREDIASVDVEGKMGATVGGIITLFVMFLTGIEQLEVKTVLLFGLLAQASAFLVPVIVMCAAIGVGVNKRVCAFVDRLFER